MVIFTIEALDASEGDCLILQHGSKNARAFSLIDGGPARTYNRALLPRLRQLRTALRLGDGEPVPIGLVVLSHIDDDHVAGLLKLFGALTDARSEHRPPIAKIDELWHNSFDDVIGNDQIAKAIAYLETLPVEDCHGVIASTGQGRELSDLARRLHVTTNVPFHRLVARPDDAAIVVNHADLRLTVLGPSQAELARYQGRVDQDLRAGRVASAAAALDTSEFNLASIMLLVERGDRRALLAGDGRGDHLLAGLTAAGLFDEHGKLHVDVFKLPHHASCRNVTPELLRRVTADNYIISANGKHGNPDVATLAMLAEARGSDRYTLLLTFPESAYEDVDPDEEPERRDALEAVHAWLCDRPKGRPKIIYRERAALGVRIELGDDPGV